MDGLLGLLGGIERNISTYFFEAHSFSYPAAYDVEYRNCFTRRAPEWCFRELNAKHNVKQLWTPQDVIGDSHYRKQPDCSYKARIVKAVASIISLSFHIQVEQLNCNTTISLERDMGGTSFDVFGRSDLGLAKCFMPHVPKGNLYEYRCDFSDPGDISSATEVCVFVTALLQYEHFDAVSEVVSADAFHDYQYPPTGFPVLDDAKFCTHLELHLHKPTRPIKSEIEYVGGSWKFSYSTKNSTLFDYQQKTQPNFLSAYSFHEGAHRIIDYHNFDRRFQPLLSSYLPPQFSDKLQFAAFSSTSVQSDFILPNLTNHRQIFNSSRQIYFVGASHMRYNFDALTELFFGQDILPKDRKHNLADFGNLHFRDGLFANDVAGSLSHICSKFENLTNARATIIFQLGAWDLMYSTLRRFVYEPRTVKNLSQTIELILNGSLMCKGAERIVWLTSLPYPNCFNEKDYHCWWLRTFKNNAAIASFNQNFFASLEKINNRMLIPLTVIDAYSIVAPRLTLNYENEVICSNHFICRVEVGREKTLRIAYTPGGSAVLESILRIVFRDGMP